MILLQKPKPKHSVMKHKQTLFSMLLLSLVSATPLCSNAQSALDKFHMELGLGTGTPKDKMTPFGANIDLNYSLTNRFSLHALSEATYFIPKEGMTHKYNQAINLGGGLSYTILPPTIENNDAFELRASVTSTIGSSDFKNTAYKLGLYWVGNPKSSFSPVVGVGYSFQDFRTKGLNNYHGLYVSIGFRF